MTFATDSNGIQIWRFSSSQEITSDMMKLNCCADFINSIFHHLKHVLRGIHVSPYAKLITCVSGAIYDVVVDLRPESSTYLKWAAVELTEDNCKQLFIPPLCGHGFYSQAENSTIMYCQVSIVDEKKLKLLVLRKI